MPAWSSVLAQTDDAVLDESLETTDWIQAGVILVVGLVVAVVAARIVRSLLERALSRGFVPILAGRLVGYVLGLFAVIYALRELGVAVGPLIGALGLSGLVLALALQGLVENLVAGVFLQARRPFQVHETVRLGDQVGEVLDVDTRTVLLRTLDGTQLRIPNKTVFETEIENLTRDAVRRSTLEVGVAYGSDLAAAVTAVERALASVTEVVESPAPQVLLTRFGESSVDLTTHYWHASDVPTELRARHGVIAAVDRELAAAGITIPFPQVTVWSAPPAER